MKKHYVDGGLALGAASMALAQGAGNTLILLFETESKSKPVRLILRFDPKGLEGTPPSLRFTVPDPSFRVDVRAIVRPNCE